MTVDGPCPLLLLWIGLPQAQTLKLAGMETTDPFALVVPSWDRELCASVDRYKCGLNFKLSRLQFNF